MADYFLTDRGIFDHPLFSKDPYSKRDAWLWLIANACYKDRQILIGDKITTLKRGQLSYSLRFMAAKWLWPRSVIARYLARLEASSMIGTASGTGQMIITIYNYDKYQLVEKLSGTGSGTASGTAAGQQRDSSGTKRNTINTGYTVNTKKDSMGGHDLNLFPEEQQQLPPEKSAAEIAFEQFWAIFPKRRASPRAKALEAWQRALTRAPAGEIIKAAMAYAKSDEVKRGFAKATTAWLNDDRWTWDYAAGSAPQKQTYNLSNPKKKNTVTL